MKVNQNVYILHYFFFPILNMRQQAMYIVYSDDGVMINNLFSIYQVENFITYWYNESENIFSANFNIFFSNFGNLKRLPSRQFIMIFQISYIYITVF